jgi:hypothetical protein
MGIPPKVHTTFGVYDKKYYRAPAFVMGNTQWDFRNFPVVGPQLNVTSDTLIKSS